MVYFYLYNFIRFTTIFDIINLPPDESSLFVPFGLSIPYLLQTIELAISLINEELFKFSIFILVLALVYKLSDNRKMSVVCAAFVTMIIFGAWHFTGYGGLMKLISDIIGKGLGSICEVYAYIKTKNILIPYFIHLFFDIYCDLPYFFSFF